MVSGRLFISNPVLPVPNTRLYLIFCPSIRLACYSYQIINPLTRVFIHLIDLIINSCMLRRNLFIELMVFIFLIYVFIYFFD